MSLKNDQLPNDHWPMTDTGEHQRPVVIGHSVIGH
jgi:hypothetical protein